ncbi:MAG: hypothetical protein ACKO4Z_00795 [Planctomycetota bacterium]
MIAKFAIVFAGAIVTMMFARIYALALFFVTATLLGVDNTAVFLVQYVLCLIAGAASAFSLMRRAWPTNAAAASKRDGQRN